MKIEDQFDHAARLHMSVLETAARIDGLRRGLYHKRLGAKGALALRMLDDLAHCDSGATSLEVAERLGLPRSTVSRMVTEMAERGWIRFEAHPSDRRCKCLWLTEAGDVARGKLLAPLLRDMARLAKLKGASRMMEVNYDVQNYRKTLSTYVRSVKMPKRRRPTSLF